MNEERIKAIEETIQQDIIHYKESSSIGYKQYWLHCLIYDAERLLKNYTKETK